MPGSAADPAVLDGVARRRREALRVAAGHHGTYGPFELTHQICHIVVTPIAAACGKSEVVERTGVDGHAGKSREDRSERCRCGLAGNEANYLNRILRREEKVGDGARRPLDVDVERALQPIDECEGDDVEWSEAIEIAQSGIGIVEWRLPAVG